MSTIYFFTLVLSTFFHIYSPSKQDFPVNFDLSAYSPQQGISVKTEKNQLKIEWTGEQTQYKLELAIEKGSPVFTTLQSKNTKGKWQTMARDFVPEYSIVSGIRRVTQQQTEPLEALGKTLDSTLLNTIKWDAFWDAPLFISETPSTIRLGSIPASEPFANHPGMPRKASEIDRSKAEFQVKTCKLISNGKRLEIHLDGVRAGIFDGYLQIDIINHSNLIRMMLVARTIHSSVAFKYNAGLSGLPMVAEKQLVWTGLNGELNQHLIEDAAADQLIVVKSANRMIACELTNGAMALFPPPHSFYWARETEENLGYSWYKNEGEGRFGIGVRQAEQEENPEFYKNFALYSARPGTWQRMPFFINLSDGSGDSAIQSSLRYTHGDKYQALDGYKVMGHHYHVGLVDRLQKAKEDGYIINDVATLKNVGMDIYGVIDGVRDKAGRRDTGEAYLKGLDMYYKAARSQSDANFLLMPCDENSTNGRKPDMGGHYDIIPSKPIFWRPKRDEGQALMEMHPKYGKVYNLGEPMDMMKMAEKENVLIAIPHPDSKGSTGYPEAIENSPQYLHPNYFGLGYRWGMGIDASETRLGEYRFLTLWDKTNNHLAQKGLPPKYAIAISEARSDMGTRGKPASDDIYGMSPVNYLKIDKIPSIDDMSPIVNALKNGDFFITTGEILLSDYEIKKSAGSYLLSAKITWTFPLDIVEFVWGDGETIHRELMSVSELPAFGSKVFEFPFDLQGKKWIRFAAWDMATNGVLGQPVDLTILK
ncbi:MAG: hypothetical protein HC819_13695 [Cyclobacteriaceae bacterium]|nr:hypothetical protein [Cyclobacteriaceae bacterium]